MHTSVVVLVISMTTTLAYSLIPSQLLLLHSRTPRLSADSTLTKSVALERDEESALPSGISGPRSKSQKGGGREPRTVGFRANIGWRAVSHDDLRLHPLYESLPPYPSEASPDNISPALFHRFRQDSLQWALLHSGRLTTSIAAACAGFYEEANAKVLGVPRSLVSHSRVLSAWNRLLEPPLDDLAQLCRMNSHAKESTPRPIPWRESKKDSLFPYEYRPSRGGSRGGSGETSATRARLRWGSAQEATAILTAVNFFSKENATVAEVGLCPLECVEGLPPEIEAWRAEHTLPLIGASPDGLIKYPDGSSEVLEVKCSSPFVSSPNKSTGHRLEIRKFSRDPGVAVWHMAQLQLEVLCAGPRCKGAVLVALSATDGASIYRIVRDDDYITELLYWVRIFYVNFCMNPLAPEPNFVNVANERYAAFLNRTIAMSKSAMLVRKLYQHEVQRSPLNTDFFL